MGVDTAIKCVILGDHGTGKTSLFISYTTKKFPSMDVPVLLDPCDVIIMAEGKKRMLRLWDTTDEQGYTRLRPLWYPQTNVFLVCFSIASPDSFELVREKWLPQVRYMCPGVPCLIVGTKTDLRDDPSTKRKLAKMKMQPVRYKDGYVECSALTQDGLNDLFDQVNSQSHQLDCLRSNNPYLGHNCCSTASNASEEISV
ncbi:hypothetical protein N7530_004499 [Penicillium desertorum]|uniref:Uncharacterized protein n=1 Tax=Penicillium desertorum TaxID=1303715 RepID=A0A9W9WYN9_9EURO|nr:hypothetical protein N7530_004499 [Penicillium desertorum]